ncbi:MAG: shikimate kinase [Rickettsiales bacterium]|nr:shikimate kinase [Rickettsiales bacterium]
MTATPPVPQLKKTVVLIGLMGAGKSTVGRRLAKALGVEFRDSDDEIAMAAGCSIPDIFRTYGEALFRDLEQRVIERLLRDETPLVLATGGGAWMNTQLRQLIHQQAVSVWLRADIDVLLDRVTRRNTRPLLANGDKREILTRLMKERYPLYAEASIVIDSNREHHENVVQIVQEALVQQQYIA